MSVPRLEIDRSIGAAYIRFTGEPTERTVELSGSINVDLDVNGSPVGGGDLELHAAGSTPGFG